MFQSFVCGWKLVIGNQLNVSSAPIIKWRRAMLISKLHLYWDFNVEYMEGLSILIILVGYVVDLLGEKDLSLHPEDLSSE